MKLWHKNAPIFGKSTVEEVIQFIDTYITCALPEEISNHHLHELVNKFQRHSCTKSCRRYIKQKNKVIVKCRYGFPKQLNETTTMNSLEDTFKSSKCNFIFLNDINPL